MRHKGKNKHYYKDKNLLNIGDLIRYGEITKQNIITYNEVTLKYGLFDLKENAIIKEFDTFGKLKEYVLSLWGLKVIDSNDLYFNVIWEE